MDNINYYNCQNTINDLSSDDDDTINTIIETNKDNDINLLNKLVQLYNQYEYKLKTITLKKKQISDKLNYIKQNIIPLMEKNQVDFININNNKGGGKIKYNNTKVYNSVSKKYLINILNIYFKNELMANEVTNFIYNNREYKNKKTISKTKK